MLHRFKHARQIYSIEKVDHHHQTNDQVRITFSNDHEQILKQTPLHYYIYLSCSNTIKSFYWKHDIFSEHVIDIFSITTQLLRNWFQKCLNDVTS